MLCDFKKINNQWICLKCGRKAPVEKEQYMPSAKCRIPEYYHLTSNYIYNEKMKGVGDTLSVIIKKMGHNYQPISKARSKITFLNKMGIDWCDKHQNIILEWLREECTTQRIPFLELVAKSIIRLAIRKAKNQNIMI